MLNGRMRDGAARKARLRRAKKASPTSQIVSYSGAHVSDQRKSSRSVIWNTNLHRLASRHCFTMFFASETFAPKCTIDGLPAGQWAREKHVAAYGQ